MDDKCREHKCIEPEKAVLPMKKYLAYVTVAAHAKILIEDLITDAEREMTSQEKLLNEALYELKKLGG
jgi:hypothetical protein